MLPYLLLLVAGVVPDKPGDPLYTSRSRGIVLVQAAVLSSKTPAPSPPAPSPDDEDKSSECRCNGTGKSGDGIGPCICGRKCKCRRKAGPDLPAFPVKPDITDESTVITKPVCVCGGNCQCDSRCQCKLKCENGICELPKGVEPPRITSAPPKFTTPVVPSVEVLLFISSSTGDCPSCQSAVNDLNAGKLPPNTRLVKYAESPELYAKHQVTRVPTFVLLVDGKETARTIGYTTPSAAHKLTPKAK